MKQRIRSRTTSLLFPLYALVGVAAWADSVSAAEYRWNPNPVYNVLDNDCLLFQQPPDCSYFYPWRTNPFSWVPNTGPPGPGDVVILDGDDIGSGIGQDDVRLYGDVGPLGGLHLRDVSLETDGFTLNVTGSSGLGTTHIERGGAIVVDPTSGLGSGFATGALRLEDHSDLLLRGGAAFSTYLIRVHQFGEIRGHGTLGLVSGSAFELSGTVRPDDGDLTLFSSVANSLDLDGVIAETGWLDVTRSGDLLLQGSLSDPFGGVIDIGNANRVEFDSALEIDGQLSFTTDYNNELVAPSIVFGAGAHVAVIGQTSGSIVATTDWPSGATIELRDPSGRLWLEGDSTFGATTVFGGSGELVNDAGATMTLADGVDMGTPLRNRGTLEIGDSIGAVLLEEYDQSNGGSLEIEIGGPTPGIDFDEVTVTEIADIESSKLEVSLVGNFQLAPGDSFEILRVDGTLLGMFEDFGEGGLVDTFNGAGLFITYSGGDGNDIVLYTLPEPGLTLGLMIGITGLGWRQRRCANRVVEAAACPLSAA